MGEEKWGCEQACDRIKELEEKCLMREQNTARLEADLIKTKQDLAETLNAMHDFEQEHMEYCGMLDKGVTFKNSFCSSP